MSTDFIIQFLSTDSIVKFSWHMSGTKHWNWLSRMLLVC